MKLQAKQKLDKYGGGILIAVNLAAAKILGLILRRNHSLEKKPAHILFIKLMGTGSVWMAADAVAAVKEKYPDAQLILLATQPVVAGVKPLGLFDAFYTFDDSSFLQVCRSSIQVLWHCWRKKRLWVANLEVYSRLASVFALWTMAINRFDFYFNEVAFRRHINTHPVYFNMHSLATTNYNRMAEEMGAPVHRVFELAAWKASARPEKETNRHFILVNNTCSELAKERTFPFEQWIQVLEALCKKYAGYRLLLTGSGNEASYHRQLEADMQARGWKDKIVNETGQLSFDAFLDRLYNEVALVITVDSGPLHFANRLGVPVVSIWGPTHPATRIEDTHTSKRIYLGVSCSPCTHHTEVLPCGGDNFCMKQISTIQILEAAAVLLPVQS